MSAIGAGSNMGGFIFGLILGCCIGAAVWLRRRAEVSKKQPQSSLATIQEKGVGVSMSLASPPQDDLGEVDNWEGSFWEVPVPVSVKAKLLLDYIDGNGKSSSRSVDVRQFGEMSYGSLLIGHCSLRNATRTFRSDRIKHCVNEETGEVVPDITAYLKAKYESSPEFSADSLYEAEYDALRILLYVGKADGRLTTPEKTVIADACRLMSGDSRITDKIVGEMLADLDVPTLHAFKLAVGRLSKGQRDKKDTVLDAATKMVATQKTVYPSEQEAIDYMKKRFAAEFGGV
jgi:hypothetical protein